MTATSVAVAATTRRGSQPLRLLYLRRPEVAPAALMLAAWGGLIVLAAVGAPAAATTMPGMAMPGTGSPAGYFGAWLLMVVAMMGPGTIAPLRYTALNSLRRRRGRAMAAFGAGYLAPWAAFGAVVLLVGRLFPDVAGWPQLAAVLAAASVWQLVPLKARALRACHRSVPLPLRGWPAAKAAVRFGLRNGSACVGSCWCVMLVMTAAPAAPLLWTAGLAGVVTAEKVCRHPYRTSVLVSSLLALAATAAAARALAGGA